jgi:hypothetical protein
MLAEKQSLTLADLDAQSALLLPARETPATVIVSCLAVCIGSIRIGNISVNVANGVCVQVGAIADILSAAVGQAVVLQCDVRQSNSSR